VTAYIVRRILQMIPVVLLASIIVFVVFRLIPGNPIQVMLGPNPRPEAVEALQRQFGFDKPIPVQYVRWLGQALQGNLGVSFINNQSVVSLILEKLPATIELAVVGMFLGSLIGIPAGLITALKQDSWLDMIGRVLSLFGFCTPQYWLGILLVILFALTFNWFPPGGYVPFTEDAGANLRRLILPALTIGLPVGAEQMRFLRSSMLEVIRQDYIRTAHAKGLRYQVVVMRHALKNALIPFLTIVGLQLGFSLGGSVIVEQIFAWPGIGLLTIQSITVRDYAVVQGVVMFSAMIFVAANLLIDTVYTVLDPRIRYG
jgi:peptide/nickel transport system permease protein